MIYGRRGKMLIRNFTANGAITDTLVQNMISAGYINNHFIKIISDTSFFQTSRPRHNAMMSPLIKRPATIGVQNKEVRRLKCDQRRIIKAIDVLGKDGAEKALVKPKVVKEKVVKEKVVKEKVVKEKVVKEKVVKKKGDKEPVISAIDV